MLSVYPSKLKISLKPLARSSLRETTGLTTKILFVVKPKKQATSEG